MMSTSIAFHQREALEALNPCDAVLSCLAELSLNAGTCRQEELFRRVNQAGNSPAIDTEALDVLPDLPRPPLEFGSSGSSVVALQKTLFVLRQIRCTSFETFQEAGTFDVETCSALARFQLDYSVDARIGHYDEKTRNALSKCLQVARATASAPGLCPSNVVEIIDTDGDRILFALSEDGRYVSLNVNGRLVVPIVTVLLIDDESGTVQDPMGRFVISEEQRNAKLVALRTLMAVANVRVLRLPHAAAAAAAAAAADPASRAVAPHRPSPPDARTAAEAVAEYVRSRWLLTKALGAHHARREALRARLAAAGGGAAGRQAAAAGAAAVRGWPRLGRPDFVGVLALQSRPGRPVRVARHPPPYPPVAVTAWRTGRPARLAGAGLGIPSPRLRAHGDIALGRAGGPAVGGDSDEGPIGLGPFTV